MRQVIWLLSITLLVTFAAAPLPAVADAPTHVNGGGVAVGPDTSSQFGMDVTEASDGSVSGHFNCVMAGRSAMPGLSDMTVRGPVTSVSITGGTATFEGTGTLNMKSAHSSNRETMTVAYSVTVTSGGPGVGTLALVVPAAGFSMSEVVASGQISIH
jgi:hypothetical protein